MDLQGFDHPGFTGASSFIKTPIKKPQPKGNFLTHLLPTFGGIGGGVAGGAAGGALAGSAILPGVGTAVGGLIGALAGGAAGGATGKVVENRAEGNALASGVGGQALEQGVLSAGPLRLLKGAKAVTTAVKGGSGLADALNAGGKAAAAPGIIDKALRGTASKMYSQAFTVPRRLSSTVKPEQTAKDLMGYGISGSLDNIDATSRNVLKTLGNHFDNAVSGVGGQIKVGNVTTVAKDALKNVSVPKAKQDALLGRITDIGANGKLPGYANPSEIIDKIRDLEGRGYNYINAGEGGLTKNPDTADLGRAYIQVAKEMEDNLYKAMGSTGSLKAIQTPEVQQQLNKLAKGLGDKFVAAQSPEEVRSLMAPFVRAKNAVKLTRDEAQAAGSTAMSSLGARLGGAGTGALLGGVVPGAGHVLGAVGGFLGAPMLRGAAEEAGAPISTTAGRLLNKAAGKVGGDLTAFSAKNIAKRSAPLGLAQALVGSQPNNEPSSANAYPNAITNPAQSNSLTNSSANSSMSSGLSDNQQGMSSDSPFDPANLESTIAQMAANGATLSDLKDFVSLADTINSMKQAANPSAKLSSTTSTNLASSANAQNTLGQLQDLYAKTGGGKGKVGGTISNLLGDVGLNNNSATYNALAESSVSQLARALNGGGQVSDKDAAVIVSALPKITDTPAVAKAKFTALMQRLQAAQANTLTYGGGTADPSDLISALGGAY